jgi:transposase
MKYVEKEDRNQITLLPDSLEDYVTEENPVRVIDAFVESLDMGALGFERSVPDAMGRPPYDPRDLLKLYLYGYFNRIRSSRKLMQESGRTVEVMYLLGKLHPDFRTISDFRKNNAKGLRNVFKAFVKLCVELKLYERELLAVDGTKFRAVNSKDNAYNAEILYKKLARIDEHIAQYLREMDAGDASEPSSGELSVEQVKAAVAELKARKDKYEGYLKELSETGKTQILTTDPEAHRMHTKDGFNCCYNVQTAVDAGSHLIASFEVTNHNTDQGLLSGMAEKVKEALELETVEVVADKGYESREDILDCVMNGTVPNVALKYDKTERLYTLDYVEAEISEETRSSTKPEDIRTCLHAGILPRCYEGTAIEVELQQENEIGCFTRNEDGTVTCPMGQTLSKIKNKGESAIYANKDACRQCPNRCTGSKSHKTVLFGPDAKHVAVKMYGTVRHSVIKPPAGHVFHNSFYRKDGVKKKIVLRIREDKAKLKQRMCTVEHPFGTIKWYGGAHYLLCKGKEKTTAEIGLSYLAYNLKRAINMVGTKRLIEAMG